MARGSHTINVSIKGDKSDLSRAIQGAIGDIKGLSRQVGRANRDLDQMRKQFQGVSKDTNKLRTATRQTADAVRGTTYRVKDYTGDQSELERQLLRSTRAADAFNRTQRRATFERTPLFGALARTFAGLRETARAVSQAFGDIADASADTNVRLRDTARASSQASDGLLDFSHALGGGGTNGGGGAGAITSTYFANELLKKMNRNLRETARNFRDASQSTDEWTKSGRKAGEDRKLTDQIGQIADKASDAARQVGKLGTVMSSLSKAIPGLLKIVTTLTVIKIGAKVVQLAFQAVRVAAFLAGQFLTTAFGGAAVLLIAKFGAKTKVLERSMEDLSKTLRKSLRDDLPAFFKALEGTGKRGRGGLIDTFRRELKSIDWSALERPLTQIMNNLKTKVIPAIGDAIEGIIPVFEETLLPMFNQFVEYTLPGMIKGIENFFIALGGTDLENSKDFFKDLGTWFEDAGTDLGNFITDLNNMDWDSVKEDIEDIASALGTIADAIKTVGDTVNTVSGFFDWIDEIRTKMEELESLFTENSVFNTIKDFITDIGSIQMPEINLPVPNTAGFMNGLRVAQVGATAIFNGIKTSATIVMGIPGILRSAAVAGASALISGLRRIPGILGGIWARVVAGASAMASNLLAAVSWLPGQFFSIGANIASSLASGIFSGQATVINAAISLAQSAWEAAKSRLGINSPSRVFVDIGSSTVEGFVAGVNKNKKFSFKAFEKWMKDLGSVAVKYNNDLNKKQEKAAKDWANRWNKAVESVKSTWREWSRLQTERKGGTRAERLADAWREAAKAVADMKKEIQNLTDEYNEITNPTPIQQAAAAWEAAKDKLRDIQRTIQNLNDDYAETMGTTPGFAQTQAYEAAKDKLDDLKDAAKRMGETIKDNLNFGKALEAMQSVRSGGFLEELRKQRDQTQKFSEGLAKLKEMGASPEILKQIQEAGVVDGTAIMEQLQTPEALREAEGLVKDVLNIAESVASEDTGVYSTAIAAAKDGVTAAYNELGAFWEGQKEIATQQLTDSYNAYLGLLNEELVALEANEVAKWNQVKNYWKERLKTERQGIKELKEEWKKYKKWWNGQFTGNVPNGQPKSRTADARTASAPSTVNYNFTVQATSPYSAGKEIVKNIQAYEKAAGNGWRR